MDGIRQKTNLDQRTVMASFDLSLIDLLKWQRRLVRTNSLKCLIQPSYFDTI
jgi:hypothetical protein